MANMNFEDAKAALLKEECRVKFNVTGRAKRKWGYTDVPEMKHHISGFLKIVTAFESYLEMAQKLHSGCSRDNIECTVYHKSGKVGKLEFERVGWGSPAVWDIVALDSSGARLISKLGYEKQLKKDADFAVHKNELRHAVALDMQRVWLGFLTWLQEPLAASGLTLSTSCQTSMAQFLELTPEKLPVDYKSINRSLRLSFIRPGVSGEVAELKVDVDHTYNGSSGGEVAVGISSVYTVALATAREKLNIANSVLALAELVEAYLVTIRPDVAELSRRYTAIGDMKQAA